MIVDDVLADARNRMRKATDALRKDLASIRGGRPATGLVEHIKVDYYGQPTPINQLASINIPEARLMTIQPWDRNAVGPIQKAIQQSDLGINPSVDGNVIRLVFPQLTEQRRKELVKLVEKRVEEARVAVRNIRRDEVDRFRKAEKNKEISVDEAKLAQEELQKTTDQFISEIDKLGREKEAELMEV
jgi:ribosome recycling factor